MKNELGRNFYIMRKALGYSHFDIVNRTGLTRPILSSIENASGNPTFDTLLKLSNSLEISIKVLLFTKSEFESLKVLLKDSFTKENNNVNRFIIDEKIWRELLQLSGTKKKSEQGRIAVICKNLIDQNLPELDSEIRNKVILFSILGVIFQKDGFQFGLEFGVWLGQNYNFESF